jgi:hypothetical protein
LTPATARPSVAKHLARVGVRVGNRDRGCLVRVGVRVRDRDRVGVRVRVRVANPTPTIYT